MLLGGLVGGFFIGFADVAGVVRQAVPGAAGEAFAAQAVAVFARKDEVGAVPEVEIVDAATFVVELARAEDFAVAVVAGADRAADGFFDFFEVGAEDGKEVEAFFFAVLADGFGQGLFVVQRVEGDVLSALIGGAAAEGAVFFLAVGLEQF